VPGREFLNTHFYRPGKGDEGRRGASQARTTALAIVPKSSLPTRLKTQVGGTLPRCFQARSHRVRKLHNAQDEPRPAGRGRAPVADVLPPPARFLAALQH